MPYSHAVKHWSLFHDRLPDGNSNNIQSNLRVIVLEANLFGRARDICSSLTPEQLGGHDGAMLVVARIY